jgi:ribosomal-protein-alanine N-acetyltransferase
MSAQAKAEPWSIVPMGVERLSEVLVVEHRAYEFPWTESIFKDCLKAGYSAWLLEDDEGTVIGYGMLSFAVDEAHVLNLCVDPLLQGRGWGRRMLDHLMKLARGASCVIVLLEVRKSNKAALKLYEGVGFQRLGVRKGYYPARQGREDALVLGFDIL